MRPQSKVLKADALRFLTTFRAQIPKADVLAAFPGLVHQLGSESNVVHSYAATCIERLLSVKVRRLCVCTRTLPPAPLLSACASFCVFRRTHAAQAST